MGGGFEVEAAEDTHGVERLQFRRLRRIGQRRRQVKAFHAGTEVGRIEPHDLAIVSRGFRQKIAVRRDQICQLHSIVIGIAPGTKNVALQINRLFVVRSNGKDMDLVAVLNLEGGELFGHTVGSAVGRKIQRQHGALLVRLETLHFDMPQRRRRQNSAREIQNIGQRTFSAQFVDCRPPHHSAYGDLSAHRGNQQRVAVFQPLEFGTHAVQQQVIGVNFFDELLAAIVFQVA